MLAVCASAMVTHVYSVYILPFASQVHVSKGSNRSGKLEVVRIGGRSLGDMCDARPVEVYVLLDSYVRERPRYVDVRGSYLILPSTYSVRED